MLELYWKFHLQFPINKNMQSDEIKAFKSDFDDFIILYILKLGHILMTLYIALKSIECAMPKIMKITVAQSGCWEWKLKYCAGPSE